MVIIAGVLTCGSSLALISTGGAEDSFVDGDLASSCCHQLGLGVEIDVVSRLVVRMTSRKDKEKKPTNGHPCQCGPKSLRLHSASVSPRFC